MNTTSGEFLAQNFSMAGHTVLVTGAGSGIGRAGALALAMAGARLILVGRRAEPLDDTARAIRSAGGDAEPLPLDVSDTERFEAALVAYSVDEAAPTILVNNAGVGGRAPLVDVRADQFDHIFGVNVRAATLLASAFARHLIRLERPGRIINICSLAAQSHPHGLGVYGASKAALEHLTRTMASEWAHHGINVNAISPGYIETDINRAMFQTPAGKAMIDTLPRKRLGTPDVLNGALLLLAGPAGAFINASTLTVDDGQRFGVR
ncbi:SDR family NAD(P)-dependent oxidoreductase [Variovorax saccharolyticus]|uniref:SDR family NAD(P)-dependent oxidoreductase n=1 Tax=Variovorax saccharolyticus TaxID=3053516 RepID=UPI0025785CD9|nr:MULTISPECIES: SDR family NAD(P)-dependent oxidoreductase [unclassified Variovorax]MDM0022371.1 SDR family oxidoreductase [Variovorax sp. J22R187]MDM0029027.1 SDR family oxidoreductase [Variovorax sp. J31P216]